MCCTLLPFGAIADIVGNRSVFIVENMLYTAWTLGVSRSQRGNQLIAFLRVAARGYGILYTTAVSTITTTFPSGKLRNIACATFGGGSPLSFAVGLVLGGVFVNYADWRTAY